MKLKKGGVRGNNRFSNRLNRPIGGKLAEKKSGKFIIIVCSIAFIALLAFASSLFGFKDGLMISLVFSIAMLLVGVSSHKRAEKTGKKFIDDDKSV